MTAIPAALAAGLPRQLVIPIAPPQGPAGDRLPPKSLGKVPARQEAGAWQPLAGWRDGVTDDWLDHSARHGANAGLVLGAPYAALDADLEPGQNDAREAIVEAVGAYVRDELADAALYRSTLPHRALFLFAIDGDAGRKVVWKLARNGEPIGHIEILATGQQCVVAGVHHSGNAIAWHPGNLPAPPADRIPVLLSRASLLDIVAAVLARLAPLGVVVVSRSIAADTSGTEHTAAALAPESAAAVVELLKRMDNPASTSRETYLLVMLAAKGCIDGLAAVGLPSDGIDEAACEWADKWPSSPGLDVERDKWDRDFAHRNAPLAGWQSMQRAAAMLIPEYRLEVAQAEFAAAPAALPAAPLPRDPMWHSRLARTDKDKIIGNGSNAALALRTAPVWDGVLGYDLFGQQVRFRQPPPWVSGACVAGPLEDHHGFAAMEWLDRQGIGVSEAVAHGALVRVAHEAPFHPVRDYLAGLRWDGKPRIDTWLRDCLGAPDTPLNRAFAAKFLVAAVARVMQPGCKVDTVLSLEGVQGIGKSSVLGMLASPAWFMDRMPDIHNKDALQAIQGRWLIELAEMAALHRTEAAAIKAFMSTQIDRFRASYGRVAGDYPRQCVFAATVNPGAGAGYLRDETGNRRFWPVACGVGWAPGRKADIDAVRAARDQLWAEAAHRYAAGESWWLETFDMQAAQEAVADERYEADGWEPIILDIIEGKSHVRSSDLLRELGVTTRDQTDATYKRVARIMERLRWRNTTKRLNGKVLRAYFPPLPDASPEDARGAAFEAEDARGEANVTPSAVTAGADVTSAVTAESLAIIMG